MLKMQGWSDGGSPEFLKSLGNDDGYWKQSLGSPSRLLLAGDEEKGEEWGKWRGDRGGLGEHLGCGLSRWGGRAGVTVL